MRGPDKPPDSPVVPPVRFVRANTKGLVPPERGGVGLGAQRVSPRVSASPAPSPQRSPASSPRGGAAAAVLRPVPLVQSRPSSSSSEDGMDAEALSVVAEVFERKEDDRKASGGWKGAWRRSLVGSATAVGGGGGQAEEEAGSAANNQLYAWGWRDCALPVPVPLAVLRAGESVVAVSVGSAHVVALTDARRVFSWGRGAQGQLGHGDLGGCETPRLVEMLDGSPVARVAAGGTQTAAVAGSEFFWWGAFGPGEKPRCIPTAVEALRGVPVRDVAAGTTHMLVCTAGGDLLGWGHNELGQLSAALPEAFCAAPVEVDRSKRVAAVAAGEACSACLLQGAQVMVWGSNWLRGKPGVATKPLRVSFPRPVTQIALGERHLLALSAGGEVFALGYGEQGQLGTGKMMYCADVSTVVFSSDGATLDAAGGSGVAAAAAAPNATTTTTTTTEESETKRNIWAALRPLKRRDEAAADEGEGLDPRRRR